MATAVPLWAERLRRDKGIFSAQMGYVNFDDVDRDIESLGSGAEVDAHTSDGHLVRVHVDADRAKPIVSHAEAADCPRCCEVLSAA